MTALLTGYLVIYSLMHLALYGRIKPLLPRGRRGGKRPRAGRAFALFSFIMIILPLAARALDYQGLHGLSRTLAWVGYPWMAFMLVALPLCLASWLVQLVLAVWARARGGRRLSRLGYWLALMTLLAAAGLTIYGFNESTRIRLVKVPISTEKLPPGWPCLRIAFTTDLHLGATSRESGLRRTMSLLRMSNPDIWLDGGDLVDGRFSAHGPNGIETKILSSYSPPLGKYSVLGNHEFYMGPQRSQRYLESCGFKVLRGKAVTVGGVLNLAGIDDPGRGKSKPPALPQPPANGLFSLILMHRPLVGEKGIAPYDLQLSGHTHGGQIFPYNFLVKLVHPRISGLFGLPGGGKLYTSRGTGYWGPPIRLFAPPEVTIIELHPPMAKGS